MKHTAAPFTTPKYVMAKPAGPLCNLDCKYCYYTEKSALLGKSAKMMHMSDELLEEYIRQYIAIQPGAVLFTWHGGEPLLRSRDFYEKVLTLQRKYANGKQIDNSIQTNGTLITDDWA
ncbi:MAG: radical SAM protein, partial [Bacteroidaceae bacterium]|nr:radical SAM protein [Bacteroidaceae bacterium]